MQRTPYTPGSTDDPYTPGMTLDDLYERAVEGSAWSRKIDAQDASGWPVDPNKRRKHKLYMERIQKLVIIQDWFSRSPPIVVLPGTLTGGRPYPPSAPRAPEVIHRPRRGGP